MPSVWTIIEIDYCCCWWAIIKGARAGEERLLTWSPYLFSPNIHVVNMCPYPQI
jgi:hypothetical protein